MNNLEEQLKSSKDRLQLLVDCMPAIVAYIDHRGKYTLCNTEHYNWFGIPVDEIEGVDFAELHGEHVCQTLQPFFEKALLGEQCSTEIQLPHRLRGSRICNMTFTPHLNDTRIVDGFCVLATDITDNKRAEALEEKKKIELSKAYRQAASSNMELEQFAYVCSHDLQEPLRMIGAYANLLDTQYGNLFDEKAGTYFQYITEGTERMQLMIDGLLEYAKLRSSETTQNMVEMQDVLHKALKNLELLIEENGAVITSDILPKIIGHPSQFLLLIQNLLSNAIKYRRKKKPEVHVKAEQKDGEWLFSVQDNGIGIDPRHGECIFDLFQRFHRPQEISGTGIGLAVCRKIIENHDGKLWYESEPGRGTTFYFTLQSVED